MVLRIRGSRQYRSRPPDTAIGPLAERLGARARYDRDVSERHFSRRSSPGGATCRPSRRPRDRLPSRGSDLRLPDPRRRVRALRMQDERLDREAVDGRVDATDERLDRAPAMTLDRLAELAHGGVLEEHARVAQALVLSHHDEVALSGRQRLLEHRRDDIVAAPVGAHAVGPAPELILVQADHLVGDGGQGPDPAVAVATLGFRVRHGATCSLLLWGGGCAKGGGAKEPNGSARTQLSGWIGRRRGAERRGAAQGMTRPESPLVSLHWAQRRGDRGAVG